MSTELPTSKLDSLITTSHGPHGKYILYFLQSLFIAPLPSNMYLIVPRFCFCGNVFSDPLPSNGHGADHIENASCNTFSIVACAYFGRCLEMGLHVTIIGIRRFSSCIIAAECKDFHENLKVIKCSEQIMNVNVNLSGSVL
jgi:hypothetical protein